MAERLMHFPVEEDDNGSSPFGPASQNRLRKRAASLPKEITPMFALKRRTFIAT